MTGDWRPWSASRVKFSMFEHDFDKPTARLASFSQPNTYQDVQRGPTTISEQQLPEDQHEQHYANHDGPGEVLAHQRLRARQQRHTYTCCEEATANSLA